MHREKLDFQLCMFKSRLPNLHLPRPTIVRIITTYLSHFAQILKFHGRGKSCLELSRLVCPDLIMDSCRFSGNSDMYGVGIRAGFYLHWLGAIIANWIAPKELSGMRTSKAFFVAATFVALCAQSAQNQLRPAEIYIILLLTFGGYYHYAPLYLWRLITCCSPYLDPTRHKKVYSSKAFSRLNFLLLAGVSIFQLWFWSTGRHRDTPAGDECTEYGFLFAKIPLQSAGFAAVNIVLHVVIMLTAFSLVCLSILRTLKYVKVPEEGDIS